MEIKTRYDVGDRCYTLINNELYEVEIARIRADVMITGEVSRIYYYVKLWDELDGMVDYKEAIEEYNLFATTTDLCAELLKNTHALFC